MCQCFKWNFILIVEIKFCTKKFYKNALHIAVENEDIEIVESLLAKNKIDINDKTVRFMVVYIILNICICSYHSKFK